MNRSNTKRAKQSAPSDRSQVQGAPSSAAIDEGRLRLLVEAGASLTEELSLDAVLEKIVHAAREVTGARYAALALIDEAGNIYRFLHAGMTPKRVQLISHPPEGKGLFGLWIEPGQPVRMGDVRQHPSFSGFSRHHPKMKSLLGVAIADRGRVLGRLYLTDKRNAAEFSREDELLVAMLASFASIAIRNARTFEETLRAERDRAQLYLDTASVMLVALDLKGNITMINRKGCHILGYTEEELLGANWFTKCLPRSERATWRRLFHRMVSGEEVEDRQYENTILTKSGGKRLIAWRNAVIRDPHGRITGTLSSGEDITERRQAQAALREGAEELARLHELYHAVVENVPASVLIFDRNLRLVFANAIYRQHWRPWDEVQGKSLEELMTPEIVEREGWANKMREVLAKGCQIREAEVPHHSPYRGETIINYHLVRLPGKQAADDKVLLVLEDVTEQVGLQRQLVQSEKLAAMGLLSAGVAHEIRTPLSVIRLAAYHIQDILSDVAGAGNVDGSVEEARSQLQLIERNVMDCNRVIENLLQFAREAKHEPTWLEISALLKGCLTLAEKDIALQGIRVEEHFTTPVSVFAGEDDLKQVFSNIVLNAVQAMPEGGVLSLSTGVADGFAVVSISDTGHGIPAELLDRIFDPFFTTKEPGKGTGLGLSICRKIIERMNGRIEVQSKVGEGTTFVVKLPVEGRNIPE